MKGEKMGYREYLYVVDKKVLNAIRRCKTKKELYDVFIKFGYEAHYDEKYDDYSCPLYKIKGEVFSFGKWYDNSEKLLEIGKPLFRSKEMNSEFKDYNAIFGGEEIILSAIEWQKIILLNYMKV